MSRTNYHLLQWLNKIRLLRSLLPLLIIGCASTTHAFQLNGQQWPQPSTSFYVDITAADGLFNNSFETAMYEWSVGTVFQFHIVRGTYSDPCDANDSRNGVDFKPTFCEDAWGGTTLAMASWRFIGSTLIETDITFNSNKNWNVYSTPWSTSPWQGVNDFHRVAVHELGHTLGLGHEDSGVSTIMGTYVGNHTIPQQDDRNGVGAMYGSPAINFSATITKSGTGIGTVASSPSGITCGNDCSESYASGTSVTFTATPASGSSFTGWSGACADTSNTCTVTMDAMRNLTATFVLHSVPIGAIPLILAD